MRCDAGLSEAQTYPLFIKEVLVTEHSGLADTKKDAVPERRVRGPVLEK